MWDNQLIL